MLCVVSTILHRNPELRFKEKLDLDAVVSEALHVFIKDLSDQPGHGGAKRDSSTSRKESIDAELAQFYNATRATTNGYLARAVVNTILRGDLGAESFDETEDSCRVS